MEARGPLREYSGKRTLQAAGTASAKVLWQEGGGCPDVILGLEEAALAEA